MKFKSTLWLLPLLAIASCSGTPTTSSEAPSSLAPSSALPSSEAPSSEAPSSEAPSSSEDQPVPIVVKERDLVYRDNDFYRNFYQIFPYSFADGNGDGVGDLRGIIDKFDYINSLGITGLWLNPISKGTSYHKYDVEDYKSIDPQFGSLADYDELVQLCHSNHTAIIHDLVLNHSSYRHPWFVSCMEAHKYGDTTSKYYDYYNVIDYPAGGYEEYQGTGLYYECRFDRSMPDFNLQGILDGTNQDLINDFRDIMRFWLIDRNIDGFRLDACTSFFTGDQEKNIEFLNWVKAEANKIKPVNYIIGEVLEYSSIYSQYYDSDTDSFFAFDDAGKYNNRIFNGVNKEKVKEVTKFITNDIAHAKGHIPAPVLANHDIGRSTKSSIPQTKMLQALFALANGATYQYYGDEMGARTLLLDGDNKDMGYRLPIQWGDSYTCRPLREFDFDEIYPCGTVKDQDTNEDSLLNFVRKANRLRLENVELVKGTCEDYFVADGGYSGILKREYDSSVVYMAMNLSKNKTATLDISGLNAEIVGELSVNDTPYFLGGKLVLPPYSLVLLH